MAGPRPARPLRRDALGCSSGVPMSAVQIAVGILLSALLLIVIAFGYAAAAWRLARRFGTRGQVAAWVLGVVAFTALVAAWRAFVAQGPLAGATVRQNLVYTGTIGLFAFGLSSLSLRKSMSRVDTPTLPRPAAVRSVGAFFSGIGVLLLIALISDVVRFVRH